MRRRRVSVALRCAAWAEALPRAERFAQRVVAAVLDDRRVGIRRPAEVGVVLADDGFVRRLNRDHRGKDKPTNVLSFPLGDAAAKGRRILLGDVVLAYRTIRREAKAEGKSIGRHAAHLLVHGTLHLLGFDHERARAARIMEGHEVRILKRLGVPDPYRVPDPCRAPSKNGQAP
ncbi:MAG TPA: rRNA maturation RNase YbeY [Alphaproteobacteria bacterium]|jgi:probable rRNA maturation factor